MAFDNLNMDELAESRREALRDSVHTISIEELRSLGEGLFPYAEHPWREKFFRFLDENAGATFHHAVTSDAVHVVYCAAQEKGVWFIPGSGIGPLQQKGLHVMKEITSGKR
jgi:hypothetical protein